MYIETTSQESKVHVLEPNSFREKEKDVVPIAMAVTLLHQLTKAVGAAAEEYNLELVGILIKYGNNPEGIPSLHYAIKMKDERAVELLLRHGANPNSLSCQLNVIAFNNNPNPLLPLDYAAEVGNVKIIQTLIEYGAEVDRYKLGELDGSNYSSSYQPPQEVFHTYNSLYFAAKNDHEEAVRVLIANGAGRRENSTYYPLLAAAMYDGIHAFRALLESGIQIGPLVYGEPYLLHVAASSGSKEIVQFLIERGVYVDIRQNDYTPLMNAKGECLELLLKAGAEPKAKTAQGYDSFYFSATRGDISAMKALLERGADINARCGGRTILSWAKSNQRQEMIDWLVAHGAKE